MRTSALEMRRHIGIDIDPYRTRFRVVVHRLEAHLAAIARFPHTAERTTRIDALVAVDPAHARLNLPSDAMRARQIARPQPAAKAVVSAIGDRQRFFIGTETQHRYER